jgi:hypothetical protein
LTAAVAGDGFAVVAGLAWTPFVAQAPSNATAVTPHTA